ncbi:hypothetical protein B0H10DRAFT_1953742 [Mycena sp. CBHHK59/15]|nr:hypothetical protein B0H10DRAFT_1953742 [Mycena sp. CBHHK59/15]
MSTTTDEILFSFGDILYRNDVPHSVGFTFFGIYLVFFCVYLWFAMYTALISDRVFHNPGSRHHPMKSRASNALREALNISSPDLAAIQRARHALNSRTGFGEIWPSAGVVGRQFEYTVKGCRWGGHRAQGLNNNTEPVFSTLALSWTLPSWLTYLVNDRCNVLMDEIAGVPVGVELMSDLMEVLSTFMGTRKLLSRLYCWSTFPSLNSKTATQISQIRNVFAEMQHEFQHL